ncbi:hypothetical protein ID866_4877 [Astraeus odoratus]|nr:hypothetical protein ID866_4877 [Astraeus odoratus]
MHPQFALVLVVCQSLVFPMVSALADPAHGRQLQQRATTLSIGASAVSSSSAHSSTSKVSTMSASGSPTSTTSSASPSPSSTNLSFNAVKNMTTCTSAPITWKYGGNQTNLVLAVTNNSVDQHLDGLSRRQGTTTTVLQTLASVNAQAGSWTWGSVNVSQGWYEIQGSLGSAITLSSPFYVSTGSNVSCLPSSSAASPSTSPDPVSNTVSAGSNKTGTIVGSVVGIMAGISLLVALIFWLRRRKRTSVRGEIIAPNVGKWGSLTSNTSSLRRKSNDFANRHYHGHTDSTTGMLSMVAGAKVANADQPGDFGEHVAEAGESEKTHSSYSHSPIGKNPFDSPVLPDRHESLSYSQCPIAAVDRSCSRKRSLRTSNAALEQQAQRIRSSMETSMHLRTERLSMPIIAPVTLERSPTSPIRRAADNPVGTEPTTVQRSASTGGSTTRRTPRKPVPHYDPSELPDHDANDTHSTATGAGGSSASNSAEAVIAAPTSEVARFPSLGRGRPVHYLIPDLPPSSPE